MGHVHVCDRVCVCVCVSTHRSLDFGDDPKSIDILAMTSGEGERVALGKTLKVPVFVFFLCVCVCVCAHANPALCCTALHSAPSALKPWQAPH